MTLLIIISAALIFLSRIIPRLANPNALTSDSFFHVQLMHAVKAERTICPKSLKQYILPHRNLYPPLYHALMAIAPLKLASTFERFSGGIFETLNYLVTVVFSLIYLSELEHIEFREEYVILIGAFFLVSPFVYSSISGPRSFNGSPRLLGQLFFSIFLWSALIYTVNQFWVYPLLSALSICFIVLSSRFAMQNLILSVPCLIYLDFIYIFFVVTGIILSGLLTKFISFKIIRSNVAHSYRYFLAQKDILWGRYVSEYSWLKQAGGILLLQRDIVKFIKHLTYSKSAFSWILIRFSYYLLIAIGLIQTGSVSLIEQFPSLFTILIFGGFLFLVMRLKYLLFLGESERYLEYYFGFAVAFCSILIVEFELYNTFLIWVIISLVISSVFYREAFEVLKTYTKHNNEICQFQNAGIKDKIVFPLEHHLCKDISYFSQCKTLAYSPGGVDFELVSKDEMEFIYHNGSNYASANLEQVCKKYDVDFVFTTKIFLEYFRKEIIKKEDLPFLSCAFESNKFILLKVKKRT